MLAIGNQREILRLKKVLSFKVKGTEYSKAFKLKKWDGKYCFLRNIQVYSEKKLSGEFGIGLLRWTKKRRDRFTDKLTTKDKRDYSKFKFDFKHIKGIPLRTGKGISQLEPIEEALKRKNCIWKCATNFGKTRMAIALAGLIGLSNKAKVLILTHSELIFQQILEQMKIFIGDKHTGLICSGKFLPNRITIAMAPTLSEHLKDKDTIKYLEGVEAIIADECHRGNTDTFLSVIKKCVNLKYRVGMSGTPLYKDDLNNLKLIEQLGEVACEVRNDSLIEHGISAKPTIHIKDVKGQYIYPAEYRHWPLIKDRYKYAYENWVVNNRVLNNQICKDAKESVDKGDSVFISCGRIKHASNLMKILKKKYGIEPFYIAGSKIIKKGGREAIKKKDNFSTKDEFAKSKNKILIGLPMMDEGVDIENIHTMIIASGGKSERQLLQRIGRSLRKKNRERNEVKIFDYQIRDEKVKIKIDGGHVSIGYLNGHFKCRETIYRGEGFTIKPI